MSLHSPAQPSPCFPTIWGKRQSRALPTSTPPALPGGEKCRSSACLKVLLVPGRPGQPCWPARPAVLPARPFLAFPSLPARLPGDFVPLAACTGSIPPAGSTDRHADSVTSGYWGGSVPHPEPFWLQHPAPNAVTALLHCLLRHGGDTGRDHVPAPLSDGLYKQGFQFSVCLDESFCSCSPARSSPQSPVAH